MSGDTQTTPEQATASAAAEPSKAASPVTPNPAKPPAGAGGGSGDGSNPDGDVRAELEALKARNAELETDLHKSRSELGNARKESQTLEERVRGLEQIAKAKLRDDNLEAALSKVPSTNRELAKVSLLGIANEQGIDLATDDARVADRLADMLGKRFPTLMQTPEAPAPSLPRVPAPSNGVTPPETRRGVVKPGSNKRIL